MFHAGAVSSCTWWWCVLLVFRNYYFYYAVFTFSVFEIKLLLLFVSW
jgi:hypothetical protein